MHNCFGTYDFQSGNKYVGEWKYGKYNGEGIKTFVDGTVKEGIWKDDEFLYAQKISPPVLIAKTCSEDVNACTKDQLCTKASMSIGGATYQGSQQFVTEAKRRGLTCGVTEVEVQPKKSCSDNVRDCNKTQICTVASNVAEGQRYWTKNVVFLKYVTESKRRGLSCGVEIVAASKNTCSKNDFRGCSVDQLCSSETSA